MADQDGIRRKRDSIPLTSTSYGSGSIPAYTHNQQQQEEQYRPTNFRESQEFFQDREGFLRRRQAAGQSQQRPGYLAPAQPYGLQEAAPTTQAQQQYGSPFAPAQPYGQPQGYGSYERQAGTTKAGYLGSYQGSQAPNPQMNPVVHQGYGLFPRQTVSSQISLSPTSLSNITKGSPERVEPAQGYRDVYLMISVSSRLPGGGPNPSHWSLHIPYANRPLATLIHAIGVPGFGFQIKFRRGYNLQMSKTTKGFVNLGQIDERSIYDCPTNDNFEETTERSDIEKITRFVPPPRSTAVVTQAVLDDNCQAWLKRFIEELVRRKIIDERASEILRQIPVDYQEH